MLLMLHRGLEGSSVGDFWRIQHRPYFMFPKSANTRGDQLFGSSVFWCEHPGICGPSYWARAVFPGIRTYPRKIQLFAIDRLPLAWIERPLDISLSPGKSCKRGLAL